MKYSTRRYTGNSTSSAFWVGLLTIFLMAGMAGLGCEGPTGPEGEEGPEGPVGPAGEDGSEMYANDGEPGSDIGDEGDFYLDQETGELYGPKDSDGWGDSGVVLMGDDGEDGEDGQDGEDGSQIHAGSGEPDAELGAEGDYYLNEDDYEMYGPKTGDGWGSPLDLKGADGNANVTRYIFPGHDYAEDATSVHEFEDLSGSEIEVSAWEAYLVLISGDGRETIHVPTLFDSGYFSGGFEVAIKTSFDVNSGEPYNRIEISHTGPVLSPIEIDQIEIVRIEPTDTEDRRLEITGTDNSTQGAGEEDIIPDELDVSDYDEVAEYYGWQ